MKFFNKFFNKLQNINLLYKIVLSFFVLAEITSIYIVYAANLNYVDTLKKSSFERIIANRSEKKLQLQNWIWESQYEYLATINSVEFRSKAINMLKSKPDNVEYAKTIVDLKNKLENIVEKNSKIDSIFVLDNSEKILLSVANLGSNKLLSQDPEESYKSIVKVENTNSSNKLIPKNSSITFFNLAIKDGKPIITFVNRILDENGAAIISVLVNIKFDQFISSIFDDTDSVTNIQTYFISKLQDKKNLIISKGFQGIKTTNEISNISGFDSVIKGAELSGDKNTNKNVIRYKNYARESVFGSYTRIENLNIILVSEINEKDIFDSGNRIMRNNALIATGLVVFMTMVCYFVVRQRMQSVFAITDVALSIAEGNLESKFPVKQQDEIGALAIAFNNMLNRFKYLNKQFIESQYVFSQQVNQSDEILQNLMDSTNEGVAFLDRNNLISQINFNLAEILSISIADATGARYDSVFPEEICHLIDSARWNHQEIAVTEFSIPYQDTYKARVCNVFCEAATSSGKMQFLGMIVVIWKSISPILSGYSSDESYHSPNNNNYDASDIRDEISTSLRTPMTSLLGFLKLTKGKLDGVIFPKLNARDDEAQRIVRQISNNFEVMITESTQIAMAIEDILNTRTPTNDPIDDSEQKIERILIDDILNQVNLETLSLFKEKDSRLIFDIVESRRAIIECNREEIAYVFSNLLTRVANFLNPSRIAVCHATLINARIAVVIGEVNSLLSNKQILSIVGDVYKLIDNIDNTNLPSREMALTSIQDILQKYDGTVSLEQVDSFRNRCKFYVVTLPNKFT